MHSIFIIINTMGGGGAEKVVSDLERNLSSVHCRVVTLLTPDSDYPLSNPPLSLLIEGRFSDCRYLRIIWKYSFGIIKAIFDYRKLLVEHNISASISVLEFSNIVNVIACKLQGVPSIISVHSNPDNMIGWSKFYYYARKIGIILGSLYSKKIIAVSNDIKNVLVESYHINPDKISVIYNPISISNIQKLSSVPVDDSFFNSDCPIIISVGNLKKVKGQWHLLHVFAHLRKMMSIKLVFCGDGDLKSYLQKLAKDYGVEDDVLFTGWVDNPYKYIAKSTVFVSTSLSEAFSMVLVEAMACGCPVISTDCNYGPREVLGGGKYGVLTMGMDGLYHDFLDPLTASENDLLEKLLLLLCDTNLQQQYISIGIERAKDFDSCIAYNKYSDLLRSIL